MRELAVPDLPPELDGLRVAHLSDWHLGMPLRGDSAVERAVSWVRERRPDLVCVTGDLVARATSELRALRLLERLDAPWVALGNHDLGRTRDPWSRRLAIMEVPRERLLLDRSVELEVRGRTVELAGIDPRTWLGGRRADFPPPSADLRVLLCHFPRALDYLPTGRWHVVLAGHLHAGQIVLPYGRGRRLLLAHPGAPYPVGVYRGKGAVMHVSPGLGTTFVPFRMFARPEATELVLRRAAGADAGSDQA